MLITFEELRNVKHSLPTGSIQQLAERLNMEQQSVRNFFGAKKDAGNLPSGWHKQPGYNGGVIKIENPFLLNEAKQMIDESQKVILETRMKVDESLKLLK